MNDTKWLTVKEASLHCFNMGLPRSTKSLRRWCAKEDVEAQKRQTNHGEKWFLGRESLEIKIKEELEFLKQSESPLLQSEHLTEHSADMSGHERTQADISAHERTRPDTDAQGVDTSVQPKIRDLEDQILLLKHDIKWRDQVLKDQKQTNQILMDEIKGQSRYIGHLETLTLGSEEKADQTFLAPPVPNLSHSRDADRTAEMGTPEIIPNEQPHPDQRNLYTG